MGLQTYDDISKGRTIERPTETENERLLLRRVFEFVTPTDDRRE